MLTHYLRIAWRVFRRNKLYSLINIGCLSIGLGAAMTILLYILHEHSYDKWHANSDRIFEIHVRESFGDRDFWFSGVSAGTGPAGEAADPHVQATVRTADQEGPMNFQTSKSPSIHFKEKSGVLFADSNFFEFFSFRLLRGRREQVLTKPLTAVLTQTAAKKYFGIADPVGKILLINDSNRFEVTGIAADPPSNSSIRFAVILSMASMGRLDDYRESYQETGVRRGRFSTWMLLRSVSDTGRVAHSLGQLSHLTDDKVGAGSAYSFQGSNEFSLRRLSDSHSSRSQSDIYLHAFSWAAGLILLLALVNYVSLATARSAARAREVGVRKVLGAARNRIAGQFYVESALYAAGSFATGFLIFLWFRTYFCQLIGLPIDARYIFSPDVLMVFGALLLLVIVASASYPALLLSAFKPVVVLYGKLSRQRSSERVRKGFIVVQFALAMAMITCSIVIGKQLYFFRHTETGVDRENVVVVPFANTLTRFDAFKKDIGAIPGIRQTSISDCKIYGYALLELAYLAGQKSPVSLDYMRVDTGFIPLLGLKWKEAPLKGMPWSDSNHMVLNETGVSAFGFKGPATGQQVKIGSQFITVAGVLKDFNFFGMHSRVDPLSLHVTPSAGNNRGARSGNLYIKIDPHVNIPTMMDEIRKTYQRYDGETPFDYQFMDETFDATYKSEDQLAHIFNLFTAITVVIGCLGLFALATFAAQQRLKEIGIRKVLGASVGSISVLLSRDFLRPVLISIFIASPVAWWVMRRWLQDFPYRTQLSWWIFPAAGVGLLLVAQLTVLFRTVRAARVSPTVNLRNE